MKKVIIKIPPKTKEEKLRWKNLNRKNFEKVIWSSIQDYNYKAQLDIANILYKKLQKLIKEGKGETSLAKNIALRLMQLFYETADQFALVLMSVIYKNKQPVYITYVKGSNTKTKDFFGRCAKGKITKKEILQIWGLDKLKPKSITNIKMRDRIQTIIDDTVAKEKKNLKLYGNSYTEYNTTSKKTEYSSSLLGSFAIKHGFKQIIPNTLSQNMWKFDEGEPTIMQDIVEITLKSTKETKQVIKTGSLFDKSKRDIGDICKRLIEHITYLSRVIQIVVKIQLSIIDDPYGSLTLFAKNGILKIGRNEPCPCNSSAKWKKCHGRY